jgi:hypothetical protein
MAANRNCIRDLEELRVELKHFFHTTMLLFTTTLLGYADELDAAYRGYYLHFISFMYNLNDFFSTGSI